MGGGWGRGEREREERERGRKDGKKAEKYLMKTQEAVTQRQLPGPEHSRALT